MYWPITTKFSEPQTNYCCCLPASHDRHVMEIYGYSCKPENSFSLPDSVGNDAIEPERSVPCLKKEESEAQKKDWSLIIYRCKKNIFFSFRGTKSEWTTLRLWEHIVTRSKPCCFPLNGNCFFLSVSLFCILGAYSFIHSLQWWKIMFSSFENANQLNSGVLLVHSVLFLCHSALFQYIPVSF